MTDEKMAEEYVKSNNPEWELEGELECHRTNREVKQAFLAGFEAGRPKWHKLSEDPEDLPKEAGYILSPTLLLIKRLKGASNMGYTLGKYNFSEHEFVYASLPNVEEVIAWCEIPKFEVVENV